MVLITGISFIAICFAVSLVSFLFIGGILHFGGYGSFLFDNRVDPAEYAISTNSELVNNEI